MTPDCQPDPAAWTQDPPRLPDDRRSGSPDPPEAGHHRESAVFPRHRVHVAHPYVGLRAADPGDGDEPRRCVDASAVSAAQRRELDGQASAARDVEQPIPGVNAEPVMHGHVLPAVGRFA